ncbi:unnamed protein product [Brassicogethes aeneus]|uniref:Uncharacterized protein n=1 Tax=Brassicogethes aeneus TaxID=1431903 RepID=A0A9P0BCH9_BRAAE|nr:unnamed protein product [Brassicogethes aeneus]
MFILKLFFQKICEDFCFSSDAYMVPFVPDNGEMDFGFFGIREVKLSVSESANLVIRECVIFWEKARIPTRAVPNCVKKLVFLYQVWRDLQKNCKKPQEVYIKREQDFQNELDNLFDVAHAEALNKIEIEEDRLFLQQQREPGRPGFLAGVDKKFTEKEERLRQRNLELESYTAESASSHYNSPTQSDASWSSNSFTESLDSRISKRGRQNIFTSKLVTTLDRCQLSIRNSVYIVQAVMEALGLTIDEFAINKSSIQRIRTQIRKERAEMIKNDFQNNIPEIVTIHWDGKLLPAVDVRSSKEERLPIVISYENKEQLLAVPKLDSSSGKEQALAVFKALHDWDLSDNVQIMSCDTTASNTGRFNGACTLLEQKLEKELLLFPCRHHVYELVLKSFKISAEEKQVLPDVSLFIATSYVKPWLQCTLAAKAPNQDLSFLKSLKKYEAIDKSISNAALTKFCQHLWYLCDEIAILALFDDEVDDQTKTKMVSNLEREKTFDLGKRYIPSKEEISNTLYGRSLEDFVSNKSKNLFSRLKIDDSFLKESVSSWKENKVYLKAKSQAVSLKAINDTAERAVKLMQDFHVRSKQFKKSFSTPDGPGCEKSLNYIFI